MSDLRQETWAFAPAETPPKPERWAIVRVTAAQRNRLNRLAADLQAAHEAGRTKLPNEFAEHCPIHHVIERLLNECEAKRARSRVYRPRRRPSPPL